MEIIVRPYRDADWEDLCGSHDRARLDELQGSVDLVAFLTLAETAGPEDLFDGEVWVACDAERTVGFVAAEDDAITWLDAHPDY